MPQLLIVGSGGHAREVHQIVKDINHVLPTWNVLGFAVHSEFLPSGLINDLPVFEIVDAIGRYPEAKLIVAIGAPKARRRVVAQIEAMGRPSFATIVHPNAIVGGGVHISEGCVIFPACIVTTDVRLGRHVHLNVASSVSHDGKISDFVTLGPRVVCCGRVLLGEAVDMGAGAVAIPRVEIGADSVVGAGAVVTGNLPGGVTAVGVPARSLAGPKGGA